MSNEMIHAAKSVSRATQWRHQAGSDNPAGELFANGFAEADIVGGTEMLVTGCAMCTGSIEHTIRIACA
ncbi:DUF6229 family protein [Luteibacter aegosomatis]|uniref:DUF6229 family protein n=1 Tax=Luteibacter aegosomatis TaxID=2911537 RepID=UPI001FF7E234|nr:DUF6229 family protein [Luteibacter aegosomatis]UPG87318.1 DUF6229 family protein [Luteibacter aegosomatis]